MMSTDVWNVWYGSCPHLSRINVANVGSVVKGHTKTSDLLLPETNINTI